MTQKDYRLIAEVIAKTANDLGAYSATMRVFASNMCITLKEDNPRFNPDTFLTACGF